MFPGFLVRKSGNREFILHEVNVVSMGGACVQSVESHECLLLVLHALWAKFPYHAWAKQKLAAASSPCRVVWAWGLIGQWIALQDELSDPIVLPDSNYSLPDI